jgi:hypothetical protein
MSGFLGSLGINQGDKYNNSKQQKIQQGFTTNQSQYGVNNREGFVGILGNNDTMDQVIDHETVNTNARMNNFNNNIAQYGTDYKTLKERTKTYINNSELDLNLEKNYNVFINKSKGHTEINEVSQKQCVTKNSINNLPLATGFDAAYPQNFTNYTDANNACKLWAADSGKTVYAVTKDDKGKYQCYTGSSLAATITANLKPSSLYTVLSGDGATKQGGLFANGQIGVWGGKADPVWNIPNMTPANLLRKYNSTNYSSGPKGVAEVVNGGWWGTPSAGGWGTNFFPNDIAWWISNNDHWLMGTMGYFYFVYNSSIARHIGIYTVADDQFELKVNGVTVKSRTGGYGGKDFGINIKAGKNVFEYRLINTGGPGAFVFYAYEGYTNRIWFKSGDSGWAYSMTAVPDYNLISNTVIDQANPTGLKTLNPVPAGYEKCDAIIGGGIKKSSISASYGRNCSNVTNPPLNVRYITVRPNNNGDYIQINQMVVNAFVNGSLTNVAPRGTCTAKNTWQGTNTISGPINGVIPNHNTEEYYSLTNQKDNWWQLDLGTDYPVTELIYYNRTNCCPSRALGMIIQLTANDGTIYQPITLTAALKQNFNVSTKGLTATSPVNIRGGEYWNGYSYNKSEAAAICTARGQRLCTKAELNKSDFCSCGWTSDSDLPGYPMAHGDPTPQGWCGGTNGGQVWRTCGWTKENRGSAHCCK